MVFFRRRGLPEKRKPTWKKYTIAYTGTAEKTAITTSVNSDETAAKRTEINVTYYDNLVFAADGTATARGSNTVSVSYDTYSRADVLNGRIVLLDESFYFVLSDPATREINTKLIIFISAYVYKNTYGAMTAATAKDFTEAGTYIEDVESEDENAYPDNGPLGTYYYIKQ